MSWLLEVIGAGGIVRQKRIDDDDLAAWSLHRERRMPAKRQFDRSQIRGHTSAPCTMSAYDLADDSSLTRRGVASRKGGTRSPSRKIEQHAHLDGRGFQ